MKEKSMLSELYISKNWLRFMFVYYFLIFLSGNVLSILSLFPKIIFKDNIDILALSLMGGPGMACVGSSIFYIRKIYKSCIQQKFVTEEIGNFSIQRYGTVVYYLARPFFAIGFSLLVIIGIKSGSMLIAKQTISLDNGFLYLTMFSSFFVGFSTGKYIQHLEGKSAKIIDKL